MKKLRSLSRYATVDALIAAVGVCLLTAVFPFVMKNGYDDITVTRFLFFSVLSALIFIGCLLSRLFTARSLPRLLTDAVRNLTLSDAVFLAFLAALCFSAGLSEYSHAALTGSEGRYMGLLTYLAIALMYLWITRCYALSDAAPVVLCGVSAVVVVFSLLQFEGIDLFGLLDTLDASERKNFLSPFGNINVYAGYLAVTAPVSMLMSCLEERRKLRLLFRALAAFGFVGLMTANSDSGYVAYGTAFLILFLLCGRSPVLVRRYAALVLTFFCSVAGFSAVFHAVGGTRGLSSLSEWLTAPPVCAAGIAVSLLGYALLAKFCNSEKRLKTVRIVVLSATGLVILAFLGAFVYFSVFNTAAEIGFSEKYLRFNDAWGTDRGYVWRRLLYVFRDCSLRQKLFGSGEDTVKLVLLGAYGKEMLTQLGYVFDNAHNEFLQYLTTTGLVGLLTYLGVLFAALKTGFAKDSPVIKKALALAAAAYAAQSFFNILQPISAPLFFMALSMIHCRGAHPTAADELPPKA